MSDPDEPNGAHYSGLSSTETGQLAVFVIVMLSLYFAINAAIVYLRSRRSSRQRPVFAPGGTAPLRGPLDRAVLDAIPVAVYRSGDSGAHGGLACAVCLSELADGEEARVLPGCGHGFHVGCVDTWFRSDSTCPLCRLPVGPSVIPTADKCSSSEHRIGIVPDSSSSTCP